MHLSHVCCGIPNMHVTHLLYAYNMYFLDLVIFFWSTNCFTADTKLPVFTYTDIAKHIWVKVKSLFYVAFSTTFLLCVGGVWSLLLTVVWTHTHASVRGLRARQQLQRCACQVTSTGGWYKAANTNTSDDCVHEFQINSVSVGHVLSLCSFPRVYLMTFCCGCC